MSKLRILFFMSNFIYTRNFDSTLRLLLERGHDVHVAFEKVKKKDLRGETKQIDQLCREFPNLSYGFAPRRDLWAWSILARKLRLGIDYLRYLEPRYQQAVRLRGRAEHRAPKLVTSVAKLPLVRTPPGLEGAPGCAARRAAWVPCAASMRVRASRRARKCASKRCRPSRALKYFTAAARPARTPQAA